MTDYEMIILKKMILARLYFKLTTLTLFVIKVIRQGETVVNKIEQLSTVRL